PFILLPFVENAFKHVSKGKTQANFIKLTLFVTPENVLHLYIKNSRDEKTSTEHLGIGLKNIQRRLNLIYPNRHTLEIEREIAIFKVSLKINL
ncbi:MAG: sensor histidine kinase, partial [Runella zeae]